MNTLIKIVADKIKRAKNIKLLIRRLIGFILENETPI